MNKTLDGIEFGSKIHVQSFEDPVGDVIGVDPRSSYVTRYWLPFLGPSTTLLLQVLAAHLDRDPQGSELEVSMLAWSLGLGEHAGRHGPFVRSIGRAIDYRLAVLRGPTCLAVRRKLPPLPGRLAQRLPSALGEEHARLLSGAEQVVALDALARRGRQLALSLLELGETVEEAERQLLRWRFSPPLARRCARWAASQPRAATTEAEAPTSGRRGAALVTSGTGGGR